MIYPSCLVCGHLEQNHQYKICMHCALAINFPNSNEKMTGYCGYDNLRYLEKKAFN
jgi:ribosomal protein L40E